MLFILSLSIRQNTTIPCRCYCCCCWANELSTRNWHKVNIMNVVMIDMQNHKTLPWCLIIIFVTLIKKGLPLLAFSIVNRLLLNGTSEPSHPMYEDESWSTGHWAHGAKDNGLRSLMFSMRSSLSLSSSSKEVYVSRLYPTKWCITSHLSILIEVN